MWPMTGGCHLAAAMGCDNYKTGCGWCPQLGSRSRLDLSRVIWRRKRKYLPRHMKIIGISRWLSNCARESALFKDFDVQTIHNNVDTDEFFPVKKDVAKDALGIGSNNQIILAQAHHPVSFYKGFDKFLDAISRLDKNRYHFCFYDVLDMNDVDRLGISHQCFQYLHDNISLRLLYSAADVFVAPSMMDAFGKTLAEAMACGTPVVCFDATGPKDIVDHKINGYKARPFDSADLATGIEWVLNNENQRMLSVNAEEKVLREFDKNVAAEKYYQLYESVMNRS